MNELQIFKNEGKANFIRIEVDEERGKKYFLNGTEVDRFELLALAARAKIKDEAWEIMNIASVLFHPLDDMAFNVLYGSVAMDIAHGFFRNEFYYHQLFKENASNVLAGNVCVVDRKNNGHDYPDVWLKVNEQFVPVEIKLTKFDGKAQRQLLRYMRAYNCPFGIASAQSLTVELPSNISFISFDELERGKHGTECY